MKHARPRLLFRLPWSRLALAVGLVALAGDAVAASEGGLEIAPDLTLLGVMLVIFIILIFPLNAMLFRPIFKVLDERSARIEGTRERAAQLSKQAEGLLERYGASISEARAEVEQGRRSALEEARSAHSARTSEAREGAEAEIARAREEIVRSLDAARSSLRTQSEELSREIAARVLGRGLS